VVKPEKDSGMNGIQTHELCYTGEEFKRLYEISYIWTAKNNMKI